MDTAIFILGFIWLLNGVFALFVVELDHDMEQNKSNKNTNNASDTDKEQNENNQNTNNASDTDGNHASSTFAASPQIPSSNSLDTANCFKNANTNVVTTNGNDAKGVMTLLAMPSCILLMIYSFFHVGGMMGTVIFLPPLLGESLLSPHQWDVANNVTNANQANVTNTVSPDPGQANVTTALAVFGAGGILGNISLGLLMTFGPLAKKRFMIFLANNLILLADLGNWGEGIYTQGFIKLGSFCFPPPRL